ncbi:hypothetical protein SESBI_44398 [Sesbania bispinosa]|nr:hypothetical protein SESBI_44398 [Sesbania bispinosa]
MFFICKLASLTCISFPNITIKLHSATSVANPIYPSQTTIANLTCTSPLNQCRHTVAAFPLETFIVPFLYGSITIQLSPSSSPRFSHASLPLGYSITVLTESYGSSKSTQNGEHRNQSDSVSVSTTLDRDELFSVEYINDGDQFRRAV